MKMRHKAAAMPLESASLQFPRVIEPASVRSRSGIRGMISITLASLTRIRFPHISPQRIRKLNFS